MDLNEFFISPLELRNLPRRRQLETALESYEALWREYSALRTRVDGLEARVGEDKDIDRRLRGTLLAAAEAAETHEAKARARAEAAVRKARKKAEDIVGAAEHEKARLDGEIARLRERETHMRAEYLDLLTVTMARLRSEVDKMDPLGKDPQPSRAPTEGGSSASVPSRRRGRS
jgi:cell division septum initiation protein DivIVA